MQDAMRELIPSVSMFSEAGLHKQLQVDAQRQRNSVFATQGVGRRATCFDAVGPLYHAWLKVGRSWSTCGRPWMVDHGVMTFFFYFTTYIPPLVLYHT